MNENPEAVPMVAVSKTFDVQEKAEWARRFLESGLSLRKFSAQHGLPRMSLWRWTNKARDPVVSVTTGAGPGFTEIKLPVGLECSHWAAELSRPNGVSLRLTHDVPAALLEQLLRVC